MGIDAPHVRNTRCRAISIGNGSGVSDAGTRIGGWGKAAIRRVQCGWVWGIFPIVAVIAGKMDVGTCWEQQKLHRNLRDQLSSGLIGPRPSMKETCLN
jgi:hypothetical protein